MKKGVINHSYALLSYLASFAGGPILFYGEQLRHYNVYWWMGGVYVLSTLLACMVPYLYLRYGNAKGNRKKLLVIWVLIPIINALVWYVYGGLNQFK